MLTVDGRAADRPLRDAAVAASEVVVVSVVDVRDAFEACRQPASHLLLADEATTPAIGSARGLEDAVLGEVGHDRVEVVLVERHEHPAKHLLEIRGHLQPPGLHRVDLDVRVMALNTRAHDHAPLVDALGALGA